MEEKICKKCGYSKSKHDKKGLRWDKTKKIIQCYEFDDSNCECDDTHSTKNANIIRG